VSKAKVRILNSEILSDDWYILKKTTFEHQRTDGRTQILTRETYDRGNGATVLLYNLTRQTVILTRQFRYPTFVNGNSDGQLIETAAGLLDNANPADRIKQEVEEETGFRITHVKQVFEAYMSPGSVTERLFFFVAAFEEAFVSAMSMVRSGEICDGKTIMLLQYAALNIFARPNTTLEISGDAY